MLLKELFNAFYRKNAYLMSIPSFEKEICLNPPKIDNDYASLHHK